jgi:redox-sensitive bicupin YhaK (pirin superfamily)
MITLRRSSERGRGVTDWLKSYHTFSFANYRDEHWVRCGYLRVINEDYIQPGKGFDTHPHRDMEILTYVIQGELAHQDSMGNGSVIRRGDIQCMSAGHGIEHREFNCSQKEVLHLLQIWVMPDTKGLEPRYEQKTMTKTPNQLVLIASKHPTEHAVMIHQSIEIYAGFFDVNTHYTSLLSQHDVWLQLIHGEMSVNDHKLQTGDGIWLQQEERLFFECLQQVEFLMFKMM